MSTNGNHLSSPVPLETTCRGDRVLKTALYTRSLGNTWGSRRGDSLGAKGPFQGRVRSELKAHKSPSVRCLNNDSRTSSFCLSFFLPIAALMNHSQWIELD